MNKTRLMLAGTIAALALTACGGNDDPNTPPQAATAPVRPAAPTTPDTTLPMGSTKTIVEPDITSKVAAYSYKPLRSRYPLERDGYHYAGVDARVCITTLKDPEARVSVSWNPWSLQFADDTVIESADSWSQDHFSVPLFPPAGREVRPGGCVRGWVLFEVPKGKQPVKVVYGPGDVHPVEWAAQ